MLPHLLEARARPSKKVRIWSAACSSGQEPYTLAMILKEEAAKMAGWSIEIVATDLSTEILEQGEGGPLLPVRGAARPADHPVDEVLHAGWRQVADQRRDQAIWSSYQPFNLLESPAVARHLRRHLLPQRSDLLRSADQGRGPWADGQDHAVSDGFLYLGGAETVLGISDCLRGDSRAARHLSPDRRRRTVAI